MLHLVASSIARRVLLPTLASRLALTRPISITPVFSLPAKVGAGVTKAAASQKAAKAPATAKAKAKTSVKTKAKTKAKPKVKAKPKPKPKKQVKKAEKKPAFTRADLKVPPRSVGSAWTDFVTTNMVNGGSSVEEARLKMKELSLKWKSMTKAEQQPYYDRTSKRQVEVKKEFEEWKKNVDPKILRAINQRRKQKGLPRITPPKTGKPSGPFVLYVMDVRKQEGSSVTFTETLKQAGASWRKLSETEKAPYMETYKKNYQNYLSSLPAS